MALTKRQQRRAELNKMRGLPAPGTQTGLKVIWGPPGTGKAESSLEDVPRKNALTAAAGLTKGETACNRSACQVPLQVGERWWNSSTRAFYCRQCAHRINETAPKLCVIESEVAWNVDEFKCQIKN